MTTSNIPDLGYRDGPKNRFQHTRIKAIDTCSTSTGAAVGCLSFAETTVGAGIEDIA